MNRNYSRLTAVINKNGMYKLSFKEDEYEVKKDDRAAQSDILEEYMENGDGGIFYLECVSAEKLSGSMGFLKKLVGIYLKKVWKDPDREKLRRGGRVSLDEREIERIMDSIPTIMVGKESIDEKWVAKFFVRLDRTFKERMRGYTGTLWEFCHGLNPNLESTGIAFFHLSQSKKKSEIFEFVPCYSSYNWESGRTMKVPIIQAVTEFGENSSEYRLIMGAVRKAARKSRFLEKLIKQSEELGKVELTSYEAYTFLKEVPMYEEMGVRCRLPKWWKEKEDSIKMSLTIGEKQKSRLGYEGLVDFKARLTLGEEEITKEELKTIVEKGNGLAHVKGRWIEVDHRRLSDVLQSYEEAVESSQDGEINLVQALKIGLNGDNIYRGSTGNNDVEVTKGEWMKSLMDKLSEKNLENDEEIKKIESEHGDDFKATLRGYQTKGLHWLSYMKSMGLGACLADDMGLGKTVQVIALLNRVKEEKSLLVVPASLINNWTSEFERFAPGIRCMVLHPSMVKDIEGVKDGGDGFKENDVFITTYSMVSKIQWIKELLWDNVILDEAQAIKNARTKQTRAVKELRGRFRVAMTGTPIENKIADLWSIMDFLNKGLLGTSREFTAYLKRLKWDPQGYEKLKRMTDPFILRRLKTDKNIISDLPDKIEMKTYAQLTKKQEKLYGKLVEELKCKLKEGQDGLEIRSGIARKGMVLSSLMKFKQICNHPSQIIKADGEVGVQAAGKSSELFKEKDSGKFQRLREICETIAQRGERVIIFTQFREMTEVISNFLGNIFECDGLVLHGGTPVKKRKELVDRFNGEEYIPFMVLSLKAGGVGLNLTAANHVIHFDRWWNPAVENQATDRAFRIGQKKNVIVHKFITKGTLEEKIDIMIEEKMKLSEDIISGSGEKFITEMSDEELLNLFGNPGE